MRFPVSKVITELSFADLRFHLSIESTGLEIAAGNAVRANPMQLLDADTTTPVECPFSTGLFVRLRFEILFLTLEEAITAAPPPAAPEPGTSSALPPPAAPEPGTAGGWVSEVAAVTSWHP